MNKFFRQYVAGSIATMLCAVPAMVSAESNSDTGPTPLSANARLNLSVVIPNYLYFQVGTAGTGNVDTITFSPTSAEVGNGNPIAGAGGDAGGGGANVSVRSNAGQISISENNNGSGNGLVSATSNISLSEITVVTDDATLPTPTLSDSGGTAVNVTLSGGNVTNRQAVWTYSYDNTTTPEAGTYDVEITYTAASL